MEVLGEVRCKSQYHSNGGFDKRHDEHVVDCVFFLCFIMVVIGLLLFSY